MPRAKPTADDLTRRELQVVKLVARGLTDQQIADRLKIGYEGATSLLARAKKKLKLNNRVKVAVWAVKQGIA